MLCPLLLLPLVCAIVLFLFCCLCCVRFPFHGFACDVCVCVIYVCMINIVIVFDLVCCIRFSCSRSAIVRVLVCVLALFA